MDAAWEEFIRVPFADVSINQIVRRADIPRGSFYQYFVDKRDLFTYLVRPVQQRFFDLAQEEVETVHGDLSAAPLRIYDRFFCSEEQHDQDLTRCVQIIQRNPDTEFRTLFCGPDAKLHAVTAAVDTTSLASQDETYLDAVFYMFVFVLASAILDALNHPENKDNCRRQLQMRVEIILHGCT